MPLAELSGDFDAVLEEDEGAEETHAAAPAAVDTARLRELVDAQFDFVWRSLRRLGVPPGSVDDASQQVWITVSRRLAGVERGKERSFLFAVAMRIAANARRGVARRAETFSEAPEVADPAPAPDDLLHRRRTRALVDEVLAAMPLDLRAAFVLFEIEELPAPEVAKVLAIPVGTVASRVRRARELFHAEVQRLRRRGLIDGGAR